MFFSLFPVCDIFVNIDEYCNASMMCLYPLPRFSYLVPSRQVCFSSKAARATNNEQTIFDRTFLAYRWSSLDLLFGERT